MNKKGYIALITVLVTGAVGVAIAASFAGAKFQWRSSLVFLRSPLFAATIIALAMRNVYVPKLIMDTFWLLAKGTVPLAMISIGLSLSAASVKRDTAAFAVALALKMVVMPLLAYFCLPLFGITGIVHKVAVLEAATPAAVFSGVVAAQYGANGKFAAGAVFVTTLASVVMIPVVLMLIK